jgi:hypothetical protein
VLEDVALELAEEVEDGVKVDVVLLEPPLSCLR